MVKNGKYDGYGILEYKNPTKVLKGIFREGFIEKIDQDFDINEIAKQSDKFTLQF
jgi:hypothetical protein